jgi:hypothetical protein
LSAKGEALSLRGALYLGVTLVASACGGSLDAGHDKKHGLLPVDGRNPVIIAQDDWSVDWLGELAVMLANTGETTLAGVIINATPFWRDLNANVAGWKDLLTAASASGLKILPEITASARKPLTRPVDGQIDSTAPNHSEGANLIVTLSRQLSQEFRPVVVVAATSLTDLADAYLIDPSVTSRSSWSPRSEITDGTGGSGCDTPTQQERSPRPRVDESPASSTNGGRSTVPLVDLWAISWSRIYGSSCACRAVPGSTSPDSARPVR